MTLLKNIKHVTYNFYLGAGLCGIGMLFQYAWAHGMSEAERQTIIAGGNLAYMQIGATHMLTGYDHLLFVFGVIFFLRTIRDIVKYVTTFTLGHSITLIFATFNAIQFNYFIIDAIVALSVCYIAFANIDGFRKYLDIKPPNMLAMIFALGLVHGLGLSTRLQELPLSEDSLLLNIISFNAGIELGQIFALLVMIFAIDAWRKTSSFKKASVVSNYGLILAGTLLFLFQMHGYSHSGIPEGLAVASTPTLTGAKNTASVITGTPTPQEQTDWEDMITVTIPARDGREYKFYLEQGATFEYAWQTDGEALYYDFHGDPKGDTTGYYKSFAENTSDQAVGSLTSTFAGNHGWYWQNKTSSPVVINLKAKGDYKRIDIKVDPAPVSPEEVPTTTHESLDSL